MARPVSKKPKKTLKPATSLPAWSAFRLPVYEDEGPTVTVSASIPESLVVEARDAVGSREFSKFVAQAMRRELLRIRRRRLAEEMEAVSGPVPPEEIERIRRVMLE